MSARTLANIESRSVAASISVATVQNEGCYDEETVSTRAESLQPCVDEEVLHQENIRVQIQKYVRSYVHFVEYATGNNDKYTEVGVQGSTIATPSEN